MMEVRRALRRLRAVWTATPWMHWALVFAIPMLFCLVDKLVALSAILDMYASDSERTFGNKLGGVLLGVVQDFIVTVLLVFMLVLLELATVLFRRATKRLSQRTIKLILRVVGLAIKFVLVLVLVVVALAFVAADLLIIRSREMRFTTAFIATYLRERAQASALKIDPREVRLATATVVGVAFVSVVYAIVVVCWVDLLGIRTLTPKVFDGTVKVEGVQDHSDSYHTLEEGAETPVSPASPAASGVVSEGNDSNASLSPTSSSTKPAKKQWFRSRKFKVFIGLLTYALLIFVTWEISTSVSAVVAMIALNTTLNELFRNAFKIEFLELYGSGSIASADYYLHNATETYELFQTDVLYRRTTGFKGPLAFNVSVDQTNPPNVLIIGVESFRYLDSLYLAGNTTAGAVLKKHNLSLTPQFGRWAKRGVAFSNMWSSWQTSRSLESILFGQVVLDSVTDTGTTRGRRDTKLSGMPQLFKQKGYETVFTTGCETTYDQWTAFLPSHGFDTVLADPELKRIAESDHNISRDDWNGVAQRGSNWGVHDDLSFQILGDLLINKTKLQQERVSNGGPKQPFFLNHYTISSHGPFEQIPAWFTTKPLPDFTPLCEGWGDRCDLIKKYAKLRYFTDVTLGKFLDRMAAEGVLDDTIVVISGDHGQAPEFANAVNYQTAVTRVASTLIAEGRLGEYAGMIMNDATHHYHLLNTLADITGVPDGGFLQTGVGRSLKRKVTFGSRPVWTNNPMKKMSVVRGYERFVYDRAVNAMGLFDTVNDPLEHDNLLPNVSQEKANQLREERSRGRELNAYFKRRWDKKCLTSVSC